MSRNKNLLAKVSPPALPEPQVQYNKGMFDQLNNLLRLYLNSASSAMNAVIGTAGARFVDTPNGLFYHTTDQPLDTINVGQPVEFGETYLNSGVEIDGVADSEITVQYGGIYQFTFTGHLVSLSATAKIVYLWLVKNGTAVNWSAKKYTIEGSGKTINISIDVSISMLADDHIELYWTGDDIDLTLDAIAAAGAQPGVPSAVVVVSYVAPLPDPLPTPP